MFKGKTKPHGKNNSVLTAVTASSDEANRAGVMLLEQKKRASVGLKPSQLQLVEASCKNSVCRGRDRSRGLDAGALGIQTQ